MDKRRGYQASNVYKTLKKMIITLELKPGDVLKEQSLATQLGVGRTPIREGILALKTAGLVESHPNESPFVKNITLKGVRDFFEPFLAIERLTGRLAAQNMSAGQLKKIKDTHQVLKNHCDAKNYLCIADENRKLHTLIAEATENEYLIFFHENLRDKAERLAYLAISAEIKSLIPLKRHYEEMCTQHNNIIAKLENHDVKVVELIEEHVKLFQKRIMIYLQASL